MGGYSHPSPPSSAPLLRTVHQYYIADSQLIMTFLTVNLHTVTSCKCSLSIYAAEESGLTILLHTTLRNIHK